MRHVQVEDEQVPPFNFKPVQSFLAVGREVDIVAGFAQELTQQTPHVVFVVDDEYSLNTSARLQVHTPPCLEVYARSAPELGAAEACDQDHCIRRMGTEVAIWPGMANVRVPGIRPPRVLLVDDSASSRAIAGEVLRHAGYDVSEALDGREALTLLVDQAFDVVLSDLKMPG